MPHAPYWWRRHGEIRAAVAALGEEWLDRQSMEQLFGVSSREAIRLLRRAGARMAGGAWLIPARQLLEWLDRLARTREFVAEQDRVDRLARRVAEARRAAAGRRIRIREPDPGLVRLRNLPESVRLRPGRLEVDFEGAEDLLRKLRLLSLCLVDDWEHCVQVLETSPHEHGG